MVDPDIVTRRLLALNEALADLERPAARDVNALTTDRVLRSAVERWLQVAVESCIDLAYHVISQRGWAPPESARAAFVILARHSVIEPELAERLGQATGLRNVLVHDYVSVDLRILAKVVCDDLGDLRAFGAAVGALLPTETPTR
jgi:uncharacterized protein YutE (UPF0331/DUF86 family)